MPKKIVCVHLFNDYSGSPLILSTLIKGFRAKGYEVDLLTSGGREGFLSNLDITYRHFHYTFMANKYLRLVMFTIAQLLIMRLMLKYRKEDVIVYINTLLPFGAGLAGKWMGKKVYYHIHEVSVNPPSLKSMLKNIANRTADQTTYVSHTLKDMEALPDVPGKVVYNGLAKTFLDAAGTIPTFHEKEKEPFTVLMLCSLKDYKGVREFVEIAKAIPSLQFELVINSVQKDIDTYFKGETFPKNLTIFPTQKNVHPFYKRAHLVLNLSHPERWVETFGMTILEGMHYGLPAIVPPVGGPTELIKNDYNGYQMDMRAVQPIIEKIEKIATDKALYRRLCENAKASSKQFSSQQMIDDVVNDF